MTIDQLREIWAAITEADFPPVRIVLRSGKPIVGTIRDEPAQTGPAITVIVHRDAGTLWIDGGNIAVIEILRKPPKMFDPDEAESEA